jgi:hypothetical protein
MKLARHLLFFAVAGCSTTPLVPLPDDAGPDAVADASVPDTSAADAASPETSAPVDASLDAGDASSEPPPCELAMPTFHPPGPAVLAEGTTVTIVPPPGFPADGSILYSTNGADPTSATGLLYISPIQVSTAETILAIATAPGCTDSAVASAAYTISPYPQGCDSPVLFTPPAETQTHPFQLTFSLPCPGYTICYTEDGELPTCTASGTCATGSTTYTGPITVDSTLTDPQTGAVPMSAMACLAGSTPTPVTAQTYTLQLAPPYLSSTVGVGAGLPGWAWNGTGAPGTTMTVPADAGVPYGPFQVQQVGDPPCTGPGSCTGPANQLADFLCWSKGSPATCSCAAPLPLTPAAPYATLPAAADVNPGDTLSVIACQSTPPTNAPGVYAPSSTTTVQF